MTDTVGKLHTTEVRPAADNNTKAEKNKNRPPVDLSQAPLLNLIIEMSPDGVIIIDEDGMIISFSPTAEEMFGYSANEIIGQRFRTLLPRPKNQVEGSFPGVYLKAGQHRVIGRPSEEVAIKKDGTRFPVELTLGEIKIGETRIFAGFASDMTARVDYEKRIAELQEELVHVARSSAMGELAGALAHELNQPLTAISNYAQASKRMLQSGDFSSQSLRDKALDFMDKASVQAERAGEVIWRIRRFIKHHEVQRALENPCATIMEAVQIATIGAPGKGIELDLQCPESSCIPQIMMDRIQIQQVVTNLVRNAVDSLIGWDGQKVITMGISDSTREEGSFIRVFVRDSGPGIAPEILEKLFEPFNTSKSEGVGIGLAVSKTIIDAHDGYIWAENNLEGGATFYFELPLLQSLDEKN